MDEPWLFDESSHAGPEHLDARFVSGYDRKQGYPDPTEDLDIFARSGLGPASVMLDLGAGTGQFALAAARRFGHVKAIDVSAQMLQFLRDRAAEANLANLECVLAGFLTYRQRRPAGGRGVHAQRASSSTRFLEGDSARTHGSHDAGGRSAAHPRPDLRLPAFGVGEDPWSMAERGRRGSGRGVHTGGLRRPYPGRAQHFPMVVRADAGSDRLRDSHR